MIGGPQGSGVESAANIFSRVCAVSGYQIFGKREFYSNIKGEHSYFMVRVADRPIHSNVNDVNLMVSYDAETIFRHADEVASGGAILYDSALDDVASGDIPTLDDAFRARLGKRLGLDGDPTISDVLNNAKESGALLYPVSFRSILERLAQDRDDPRLKSMIRMFNVMGVSLSLGLLRVSMEPLLESVESIFAKKPVIAQTNVQAATMSYNIGTTFDGFKADLPGVPKEPDTILIQGHLATALGKMACGCRFQPYYPITPASDESVYLESNEILETEGGRPGSVLVVQSEDEISAIGMTIGSALTGTRSSTCTSGPGFSLMAEALGWAGINEVPIVITNYQRSGPSTGLPTRHGQDDLLFTVHAGHGEFPRIVYASGDIEESFYDTARCFNYAETYQVPTIHLLDKLLASTVITCRRFDTKKVGICRGKMLDGHDGEYRRFELVPDGISPRSRLGLEGGIFWNTGDESDEYGHITEDPVMRRNMMDKRLGRYEHILAGIPESEQAVSSGEADYMIVSWGSTKGAILDAIRMLEEEGTRVGFVQVRLLNPFPAGLVKGFLGGSPKVIDIESNHTGQLGALLRQNTGIEPDYYILKYTGRPMTSTEVYDSLKKITSGTAQKREVLMHGA